MLVNCKDAEVLVVLFILQLNINRVGCNASRYVRVMVTNISKQFDSAFGIFGAGAFAGAVFLLFLNRQFEFLSLVSEKSEMLYADIAVLVLTCVTVIIACAALVIGVLGVWGFQKIKEDAVESAIKMSVDRVEKEISDGGDLRKLLLVLFTEFENRHSGKLPKADDWGNENSDYGERDS